MKNESKTTMCCGHKSIVFFGNERLATGVSTEAPVLQALISHGYEIQAVIANHIDTASRQKRDLEVGEIAQKHNIPVILAGDQVPLIEKVKKHPAELGVLLAFGKIIPKSVIDLFPKGIVNIHPSLLPKHRGSTPIESVILDGSQETGVSLMLLSPDMDAGSIYAQASMKLKGNETKQQLADDLLALGCKLLIDKLPSILDESLKPITQNENEDTYDDRIQKADGVVDWSKKASQLDREIRAYLGWPGSKTVINNHPITILKAHVADDQEDPLDKRCGDGKYLSIDQLIAPSGRKINAREFINGYC
jgi:methionyl-tRNA formyltransferase